MKRTNSNQVTGSEQSDTRHETVASFARLQSHRISKEATGHHKAPLPSRAKRKILKSSRGHFVGEAVFNRSEVRQRLGFGSLTEHDVALCLLYRRDVVDLEEQLAALPFVKPNGKASEHHFDFRATFTGGLRICVSVKPERIAQTYEYKAIMDCIKQAAIGNICDDVRTITERNICPIELHNAKLFHSARDAEPELDTLITAGLKTLEGVVSIGSFLDTIGVHGAGFRSVARAIHCGQIKMFNSGKITGRTLITRGGHS